MTLHRAVLIGTFVLAAPAAAGAQSATAPMAAERATVARIEVLEAEVRRLTSDRSGYLRAVGLLREIAALRSAEDPAALRSLELAARLSHYREDLRASRELFVEAAERATRTGNTLYSAERWVDAASIARLQADATAMHYFASRARLLAGSPHLTAADRAALQRRFLDIRIAADSREARRHR